MRLLRAGKRGSKAYRDYVNLLVSLPERFPVETTQVPEYWLDNALYSGYKKPPVKVLLNEAVLDGDTVSCLPVGRGFSAAPGFKL